MPSRRVSIGSAQPLTAGVRPPQGLMHDHLKPSQVRLHPVQPPIIGHAVDLANQPLGPIRKEVGRVWVHLRPSEFEDEHLKLCCQPVLRPGELNVTQYPHLERRKDGISGLRLRWLPRKNILERHRDRKHAPPNQHYEPVVYLFDTACRLVPAFPSSFRPKDYSGLAPPAGRD